MAWPSTPRIRLTRRQRRELAKLVARTSAAHALVQRARMILRLASGQWPATVARAMGVSDRCVSKWRARWLATRDVRGLEDADRPGRPARISVAVKCELVEMAGDRQKGVAFREVWTQQSLADALLVRRGIAVSRSTVQRVLDSRGMRPHRVRQWLHSPDPDFCPKVERVCDLYLYPPKGSIVLCIDEKPMQALFRRFPTRTLMIDGSLRREFEYQWHGTCTLLGALEAGSGRVFGHVVQRRTAHALVTFLEAVAERYPDQQVYIVWDNLNIHGEDNDCRWTRFNRRHGRRFHFVHTPIHASWVNQIEIWFSILHRRVLKHGSFAGVAALRAAVLGFIRFWNLTARPFRWTFTGNFTQAERQLAAGVAHAQARHHRLRSLDRPRISQAPQAPAPPRQATR